MMSTIVIKTERLESEDVKKPQIKEGGAKKVASKSSGGVGGSVSVVANVGPKPIVEKVQATLKATNVAKQQLKLRLKQQQPNTTQQTNTKIPQTAALATSSNTQQNSIKRRIINSASRELQEDSNDKIKSSFLTVKRFRPQTPVSYDSRPCSPPSFDFVEPPNSPSKCGEIFVTNNAKKWTFICTYCQKTTRDIGEFVCHIQFKHLQGHYNENDKEDIGVEYGNDDLNSKEEALLNQKEEDSFNNHDQDLFTVVQLTAKDKDANSHSNTVKKKTSSNSREYFDCGNYLDVNVHTDADDTIPPNNNKIKNQTVVVPPTKKNSNTTYTDNNRQLHKKSNSKYVVDLIEDDDDDDEDDNNDSRDNYAKPTSNKSAGYDDAEQYDYDKEEDEDGVQIVDDENDENVEEDHLAFLRSDSVEEATEDGDDGGGGDGDGGKGVIRKYRSHVRGKAYCNLCDKTFQYYSLYRNHMIKHSNLTPYKCQYCSKAFKSKQAIRYHMNTHTKEVQYTCPLCPNTYGTENQFITHVLNHESDTCFPCMVCAKILKTDQEREQHLETHTEERPFGCEYCNKRFRQRHHLSNHLKLHCQYRCDFCKEEFSSTQTQRRPYACPTCEDYPHIRIQVERQRSKLLNNQDVNPLEIPYENMPQDTGGDTECVDLAEISDDEESETSTSQNGQQKRITCKYCTRSYKQTSALNYHVRQKHPHLWNKMK